MEIGGPHGNGNILIQADGTMRELMDLIRALESQNSGGGMSPNP